MLFSMTWNLAALQTIISKTFKQFVKNYMLYIGFMLAFCLVGFNAYNDPTNTFTYSNKVTPRKKQFGEYLM